MSLKDLAAQLGSALERHQQIRKPTKLQFAFADRIDHLNVSLWDQLSRDKVLMMSREYLRALERSNMAQLQTRYALVFREHEPIVAMSMQILDVSLDRMHALPDRSKPVLPTQQLETQLRQRALICGNTLSYQLDGIAFAPGLDADTRWRAVAEVLYRVRRAEKLAGHTNFVVIKDLNAEQLRDSRLLRELSYRPLETEPNMVLSLKPDWQTHTDYLGSMTSKFRSSVKKAVFEPIAEAGCSIVTLSEAEVVAAAEHLQFLYQSVQNNAAVRPLTVTPEYWRQMASLGPDRCRFVAIRKHSELLGFLLIQLDPFTATAAQIGFDRAAARDLPLYLRLLHAGVEVALETRKQQLVLGRTALEPKARMGALPIGTTLWVRHRQPVFNALARGALGLIQHNEAPDIQPFKAERTSAPLPSLSA